MYNIVTKSFKPKNSLIVISSLLIFFLLASVLALTNLNDATRYFGESINQSTNGQNLQYQPPNLGGANF
jgi:cytochrome c-type biogenesis protein CcmE